MPITSVDKDLDALTMTVVADFSASKQRLWDAYADPRQLEKFWGPPTYPATFTRHDLYVGGRSIYSMTGPEGDVHGGYWEYLAVQAPDMFEVRDGFLLPDGTPNLDLPSMTMLFTFEETEQGSRLVTTTTFDSADQLQQILEMGAEEGMREAMAQIDAVLADLRSFAADAVTSAEVLSSTQVRISRVIRGTVEQVWQAHHEAELVQRWLLGPEGWSMPICETATEVGQRYRYGWQQTDGEASFGSTGEVLEMQAPFRAVTTERMEGDMIPADAPSTLNELTLTPVTGGTLLTLVVTYPDAVVRDAVLGTGMVDGMEISYARLESLVL